jgi:hypothetical protein
MPGLRKKFTSPAKNKMQPAKAEKSDKTKRHIWQGILPYRCAFFAFAGY